MSELIPAAKRFEDHRLGIVLHSILWNEWDPIGVNGMFGRLVELDRDTGKEIGPAPPEIAELDWPDDEYDRYVRHILSMLDDGSDSFAVATYLDQAVFQNMGLQRSDRMESLNRVLAQKIVKLRDSAGSS